MKHIWQNLKTAQETKAAKVPANREEKEKKENNNKETH